MIEAGQLRLIATDARGKAIGEHQNLLRERQGLFPDAIRKVAGQFPGVVVWDPVDVYCFEGQCPAVINEGEVIMDDAIHMTMEASRYSIPAIERFVESVQPGTQ